MSEKYFEIESLPNDTRIRNNLYPSQLFKIGSLIRAGDLQLAVVSNNDKKDTVTLQLVGIFLLPKGANEADEVVAKEEK